jgi:myosin-5
VENSEKQLCVSILADHGVPTDQYQLGITKVFMRAGSVGRMEDLRTRRVLAATTFQKCHRAKTAREGFLRLKNATKWAQLFRKGKRQREWFLAVLVKRAHAASKVQSFVRGVAARRFAVQLRLEKETAAALTRYVMGLSQIPTLYAHTILTLFFYFTKESGVGSEGASGAYGEDASGAYGEDASGARREGARGSIRGRARQG